MMMTFLLASVTTVMIQTAGTYLRYLPFRSEMSSEEREHLWQLLLTWAIFSISLNVVLMSHLGINVPVYKAVMFFGWLPFFIISVNIIKRSFFTHIFVLGMQCIWAIMLHTAASMIERLIGVSQEIAQMSTEHAVVYLSLFAILFPVERTVFKNLLPSFKILPTSFSRPLALLPIILFIGVSLPIADDLLLHGWRYVYSRLGLPIAFFFIYRAVNIATSQAEQDDTNVQESIWMSRQIATLKEYYSLLENSNKQAFDISQELRESYVRLNEYLEANDVNSALLHIKSQESRLINAPLRHFSDSPFINAALSIYVKRAEKLGVSPQVKINLPKDMKTDEHDLAVLLSNLSENAVEAEEKQPVGRRFLSILIDSKDGKCKLEIINLFDTPLNFAKDGLPCSNIPGRGFGMASLREFAKKYDASVAFVQESGRIRTSIEWAV